MTRRTISAPLALLTLLTALLLSAASARASHPRALDPSALALPQATLPAGAVIDHSAVSDNADADGSPSADGTADSIHDIHSRSYAALGRATGYREQFHFTVGSASVSTEYLASVFGSAASARAAMEDGVGPGSLIALLGAPLSPPCAVGDACAGFAGPLPGTSDTIMLAVFVRGPVLVEMASSVSSTAFSGVRSSLETQVYTLLGAADTSIGKLLAQSATPTSSPPTPTPTPAPVPGRTPPRSLGRVYLALGDSFAYGYLTADRPADPQCKAPNAPGFVCVFWRYLREIKPGLKLQNMAESGADSCELASGRHCYSTAPHASPLDSAVRFLGQHPGGVSPITLTIGGNDLLELVPKFLADPTGTTAMLPRVYARYRTDLDTILARLRAAAPRATIILTTQPDVFGGLGTPPLPPGLSDLGAAAVRGLNRIMKAEAPKYGALVADTAATFDKYPGGASKLTWLLRYLPLGRIEIHPTPQGYRVYGEALIAGSGYKLPIRAHLSHATLNTQERQTIKGTTIDGGNVIMTVTEPGGGSSILSRRASAKGRFSASFGVAARPGRGRIIACVRDAGGHSTCTGPLRFTVVG